MLPLCPLACLDEGMKKCLWCRIVICMTKWKRWGEKKLLDNFTDAALTKPDIFSEVLQCCQVLVRTGLLLNHCCLFIRCI